MDVLVIGKPAMNIYLPLQEFPQEGDIFTIKKKNESLGNIGATSACVLGKWKMQSHFTGVLGNDAYADKIRETFQQYNVDTKYLEVKFENPTSVNYLVLNVKDGGSTRIIYNEVENQLTRYKYDFIPTYALIDGTDFAGALALLNNNSNCKTVFYGRVADKDSVTIAKRCTYIVCTEAFALGISKVDQINNASDYVTMYQKIVDLSGNSNFVIILNNHKILYSVNGKVKMLPEMKINIVDYSSFDSVFTGAFMYSIVNNLELDDAIKFANTAAALSISKLGEVPSIPELEEVLDNSGLREKLGYAQSQKNTPIEATSVAPLQPDVTIENNNPVINDINSVQNMVNDNSYMSSSTNEVSFETPVVSQEAVQEPIRETPVVPTIPPINSGGSNVYQTPVETYNPGVETNAGNQQL